MTATCPAPGSNHGKICHPTRAAARDHLARLRAKDGALGCHVFLHDLCGSWHVGHNPQRFAADVQRALKTGRSRRSRANRRR